MNCKCKKKESVSKHAQDLRALARKAYPRRPHAEGVLVDLFARGLPSKEMRRLVQVSRPRTVDKALVIALTCEAAEEASDNERPSHKPKLSSGTAASVEQKTKGKKKNRKKKKSASSEHE